MAFIVLRRSRNTRNYYLVEGYRDEQGRPRQRTLCYLGREKDGTDTLHKALAHWERIGKEVTGDLRTARGERRRILKTRRVRAESRIRALRENIDRIERAQRARQRQAEEAEHWQAINRFHRSPSAERAEAAKRAFRLLALRLHPDQGGSHEEFIRLKTAYDRATDAWRRRAG